MYESLRTYMFLFTWGNSRGMVCDPFLSPGSQCSIPSSVENSSIPTPLGRRLLSGSLVFVIYWLLSDTKLFFLMIPNILCLGIQAYSFVTYVFEHLAHLLGGLILLLTL